MALLPLLALAWCALVAMLLVPWRKLARGLLALFLLFGAERAAAQDCGAACVFAGPRLASVESSESPLLAPILGGLLGTDISVSVLDWNAIANADLDLLGILGGLGQDITVSDPSQVANIDVTLLELVQASAAVAAADGDTALVNALNALSIPIAELNGTINLADLITIGLPQGALAEIDLNALDLIGGAIQLYNYENVLTTTEPVAIHSDALQAFGIGGAEILLQIIEPPHFECGGAGTQFHTATIRAKLTIDLANLALDTSVLDMTLGGLLGGLVSTNIALADIDLYLEVGRVDGQILSADPATKTASILLSTSSVDLYAGSIDDALFFNRSRPVQPSDIGFGTIGQLSVSLFGGLIQESAGIRATAFAQSAQGAGETLFFAPPYPQRQAIGDGASSFSTLVGTLAQNLDIEVEDTLGNLVGPLIDSTVEPLVNNLVGGLFLDVISPLLDVTVDPLLAFLGVGIGEAEAAVTSVISICSDYSDCPLSGLAPDGVSTADYGSAGHFIIDSLYMGSLAPDGEGGAQPNATATGDDETGTDDEDGVTIPPLYPGATRTIDISVTQSGGETGYLQGWIDWNGDGSFTASERVAHDATLTSGDTISLSVTVPANARIGSSFARFRWSTEPGLSPVGLAPDGEVEDLAVAIAGQPYALMSGRMMSDTGRGGGTAHDAQQNGTETGVPGVLVQVETLAGSVLSSAISNASGDWSVGVPEGYEGPVLLRAVPPSGSLAISEITSGPAELVATDPSDGVMQLNLTASSAPSGLNFGIVPEPTLSEASTTYAEAGQVATLSHDYVAGSAGDVTFSVLNLESLALDMASVTLFRDIDCNGVPDILLPGSTSVEEGDRICLVSRVPTSSALPDGAEIAYDLLAVTTFRSSSRQHSTQNSDRVVIGKETGGLVIEKSVENLTRMTGQSRSNSGGPGDVLLYRLNLSNPSAEPVTDVSVFDATPAYTTLEGTITESLLMGNGTECTLTLPDVAAAGYAGELRWDCVGPVLPGATAELEFAVRISD